MTYETAVAAAHSVGGPNGKEGRSDEQAAGAVATVIVALLALACLSRCCAR